MSKAFTPPLFGDFGKQAKDLFKKKYDYDNQAVVRVKTADDISIETVAVAPVDAPLRALVKAKVPVRSVGAFNGDAEVEVHTVADRETKATYSFNKLVEGAKFKVGVTAVQPDIKFEAPDLPRGWASAEAEFKGDGFAANVGVRTDLTKTLVDASAALGYDNWAVGAKATLDPAAKQKPSDFNFGVQYRGSGYTASVYTERKRTQLVTSYFQQVSRRLAVGASAALGLAKPSRSLTFGSDYEVDVDLRVRQYVKVDSARDAATYALAVESTLHNPNVVLGFAAEFSVAPAAVNPGKFGVSLTFDE